LTYALQFGRGLKRELGRRFVKMYVSDLTKDMGEAGEKALKELFSRAEAAGAVRKAPAIELIR
jgi:predicted solute-binding protein